MLDEVLDAVAARYRDDLAPAIERVWQDGVASIRADLREWLRRASEDTSGFVPWGFEVAFGLAGRRAKDERSSSDGVPLACGIALRGSIDLVERRTDGTIRVTDHKTGKARVPPRAIVAGGESLQPLLYALAAERLFPEARVESGRLYYCTAAGGFEERIVPLDDAARTSATVLAEALREALSLPFFPAAPARGACRFCDYSAVCGPYEEIRSSRKRRDHPAIRSLEALRGLP
jgi:CRISPR/Cas system-associated exonuclease Cas4 (RecB family)